MPQTPGHLADEAEPAAEPVAEPSPAQQQHHPRQQRAASPIAGAAAEAPAAAALDANAPASVLAPAAAGSACVPPPPQQHQHQQQPQPQQQPRSKKRPATSPWKVEKALYDLGMAEFLPGEDPEADPRVRRVDRKVEPSVKLLAKPRLMAEATAFLLMPLDRTAEATPAPFVPPALQAALAEEQDLVALLDRVAESDGQLVWAGRHLKWYAEASWDRGVDAHGRELWVSWVHVAFFHHVAGRAMMARFHALVAEGEAEVGFCVVSADSCLYFGSSGMRV